VEEDDMDTDDMRQPSTVVDAYWLLAERHVGHYPPSTPRCGKWLLFIPAVDIDTVWQRVKHATEDGLLGDSAKVATARPNPNARSPNMRVICVYTYDVDDDADVTRVREALRSLGFTQKIAYKTDDATYQGKYRIRGDTRISARYE
jgi:Domain of unknown function (DUF1917)